jgi:heavy metal sensor kinase
MLAGEKRIDSSVYLIQVAEDTTQLRAILSKLRRLLLVLTPVCLGFAAAGGYWLSTRALEPVMRMTREARSISSERLHQRLEVPKTSDELQALAETLNSMLARIESSFKRTMQFTADASHELRTPVTVMRSTAEIALRRRRDDEGYRKALASILQEAERTGNLIEDLLTLARLDSAQPLAVTNVDVRKTVEAAFARVSRWIERKQITPSLDSGDGNAWIRGDKEALIRLFFTLLDNSVKYTPPNGRIGVNICTTDDRVAVEVYDSGVGVPDAEIPRIFDRFYRVDKVRSSDEGGFGLGLAIAKSIAEMHHAKLSVESVEGQGSRFRVVFEAIAPPA